MLQPVRLHVVTVVNVVNTQDEFLHEGEQIVQPRQLLPASRLPRHRRSLLHRDFQIRKQSLPSVQCLHSCLGFNKLVTSLSSMFTHLCFSDDGAAPRSDGRVEGLDAARHPRLSHHWRQQGAVQTSLYALEPRTNTTLFVFA